MAARWLESDEGHAQLARLCANDPGLAELYLRSKVVGPKGAAVIQPGEHLRIPDGQHYTNHNHGIGLLMFMLNDASDRAAAVAEEAAA